MSKNKFSFPEWVSDFQVDDELFGQAYEETPAQFRAWLKKTIAQLWVSGGSDNPCELVEKKIWQSDFSIEKKETPADAAILVFDQGSVSSVRILAALVPALISGVKNILAVFVGEGEITRSVLAAFELSGQEKVVVLDTESLEKMLKYCLESRSVTVLLDLRSCSKPIKYSDQMKLWRSPAVSQIAICSDNYEEIQEIVSFAHPDLEIIKCSVSDVENFYAAIVPDGTDFLTCKAQLLLGHGQEGCWMWHNLSQRLFKNVSLFLTDY